MTTKQNFDTQDLLAFMEDTLPRKERERLRARLVGQPALLAKLERMAADRVALRGLEEPVLDEDLVATLEPVLARPMLMGQDAGRYRRVVRRNALWPRVAIAAGFFMLAGIGAVAWWNGGLTFNFNSTPDLATLPPSPQETPSPVLRELANNDGDLHHLEPGSPGRVETIASANGDQQNKPIVPDLTERTLVAGAPALEADFVVEIRAAQEGNVLAAMREAFSSTTSGSFVRTFTYDDAQRAWKELVAGSNLRSEQDVLLTSLRGHRAGSAYTQKQKNDIHRVVRANASVTLGERVAGSQDLAISPDDQLRLGEAGIDYALTLTVAEARVLLEGLLADGRIAARLRPAHAERPSSESTSQWNAWSDWAQAVEVFNELDDLAASGVERIIIPVDRH